MDVRWILAAQAGRAFCHGLAAVLLGATLAASGLNPTRVGLVLTAVVAGTVVASLAVGALADRIGRRRTYLVLYLVLAATGVVYTVSSRWLVLAQVACSGCCHRGPFVYDALYAWCRDNPGPLNLA